MVICLPECGVLGLHGVQGLSVQAPLQLVPGHHHPDPDQAQVLPCHRADGANTWTNLLGRLQDCYTFKYLSAIA